MRFNIKKEYAELVRGMIGDVVVENDEAGVVARSVSPCAGNMGGNFLDSVFGVAVDGAGNVYVGGHFAGSVDFGGGPLTSLGESAAFVLKLDASGGFGWTRKIDGSGAAGPSARFVPGAIATDGGSVVVVNNYTDSITVDSTTLMSAGSFDMYVLKVSASTGETLWVRSSSGLLSMMERGGWAGRIHP